MREFKLTKTKLASFSIPVVLCSIIPMLSCFLATREATSPQGTGFFMFVVPLLLIGFFMLIAGLALISAICCIFPSCRLGAQIALFICLASAASFIGGCLAGGSISNHIQKNTLAQLAKRSKPLITAIKNYEQKFGHPPDSLEILVPEFIPKVPTTGIGTTPDYQYLSLTNNSSYGNNKWVLQVYSPGEHLAFSTFIYLPVQDYSALRPGYIVWKIEDWAYWYKG